MRGKLLVKLLSAVVAAAMLLPLFYSVGLAEGQDNVVYDAGTTVEAENCTIHSAHGKIIEDQKASEGSTVELINGQPGGEPLCTDWTIHGLVSLHNSASQRQVLTRLLCVTIHLQWEMTCFTTALGRMNFVEGATTICEDGEYH